MTTVYGLMGVMAGGILAVAIETNIRRKRCFHGLSERHRFNSLE